MANIDIENPGGAAPALSTALTNLTKLARLPLRTGRTYIGELSAYTSAVDAPAANVLIATPFFVPNACNIATLSVEAYAAAVGTISCRIGIYADSGGYPSSLIKDGGTIDATSGFDQTVTIDEDVDAGWIWTVMVLNEATGGGASQPTWVGAGDGDPRMTPYMIGYATISAAFANAVGNAGIQVAFPYAVLPASFPMGAAVVQEAPYFGVTIG